MGWVFGCQVRSDISSWWRPVLRSRGRCGYLCRLSDYQDGMGIWCVEGRWIWIWKKLVKDICMLVCIRSARVFVLCLPVVDREGPTYPLSPPPPSPKIHILFHTDNASSS